MKKCSLGSLKIKPICFLVGVSLMCDSTLAAADTGAETAAAAITVKSHQGRKPAKTLDTVKVNGTTQNEHVVGMGALGSLSDLNTPFSVTTVTSAAIEKVQAYSLAQVFANDPSVSRSGADYSGWSNYMVIRGLPLSFTDSVKMDGLPLATFGVNLPLEDMESVQLLKGSSGFMYGFGAPGGIVNYVTKKPPTDGTVLSVDAGYRSSGIYSQHVDFGTRFGADKRFGIRVNASHQEGSSYTATQVHRDAIAIAFDARLTSNLVLTANAIYQNSDLRGQSPYLYPSYTYTSTSLPKAIAGDKHAGSPDSYNRTKFFALSTGLNWNMSDDWSASFTASHTSDHFKLAQEYFYLNSPNGSYDDTTFDGADLWSYKMLQAMVNGHFETGPFVHDVVIGLSYEDTKEKLGARNFIDQYGTVAEDNLYSFSAASWSPIGGKDNFLPYSDTIQRAGFASDTISLNDHWKAIVGLRYTNFNEKTWDASNNQAMTDYQKYPLTPTVAVMYKPTAGQTIYASYVQSLEPGASVGVTYANYGATLPPIESKQHEIGYKWNGKDVDATVAVFRIDRGAEYANAQNQYVQSGNLRYQGVDADLDWRATPDTSIGGGLLYLSPTYKKTGDDWMVGKQVEGTSRWNGSVHFDHTVASVPGLSLQGVARYVGTARIYNFSYTQTAINSKSYSLVDGSAAYSTTLGGKHVTFRAGVNNIFNRKYWQPGYYDFFIGAAREYLVNVKVDLL
jgi:iron complex outermembrane receptor protein